MPKNTRIASTTEAWESGALGGDAEHVRKAPDELEQQVDAALGLQAISIRLPKSVIDTYKMLAKIHGVGYQPLMRDAICRFAEGEMKQLLIGAVEQQRQKRKQKTKEEPESEPPFRRAA